MLRVTLVGAVLMAAAIGAVPAASADSGCPEGTYEAASGDCVPGPDGSTSDVTAICEDGSYSHSQTRSGTCSGHGGVARWCPCAGLAPAAGYQPSPDAMNADARFLRLLTDNPDDPWVVWDPQLLITQGGQVCQMESSGMDGVTVRDQLAAAGYGWDAANHLASTAEVAYCPWNL
jgi:uncharacterized protein DUF3761/uncharacterized protein DUF732